VVNPTPDRPDDPHNGLMRAWVRTVAAAGAGAVLALVWLAAVGAPGAAVPAVLPTAFLVAGLVGVRARPDHRGVQFLLGVGSAHCVAFAVGGWLDEVNASGAGAWLAALAAFAAYAGGFVCLALLIAGYPNGSAPRWLARTAAVVWGIAVLAAALLSPTAPTVLDGPTAGHTIAAPTGLPLAPVDVDVFPLLPLLVVVAAVVLVVRSRRAAPEVRRQLEWAVLAGGVIALLLAVTPAATTVVPETAWTVFFLVTMSVVPFILLGAFVRHRLLDVDVLVTRTLGRGSVLVIILSAYAALAGLAATVAIPLAAALAVVAAWTGGPVLRWGESWADRLFAGGRVARRSLLEGLGCTLSASDPEDLPTQVAVALREAFDATWVRLVVGEVVVGASRDDQHAPEDPEQPSVSVPLESAGSLVGAMDGGARRGGWGAAERAALAVVAPQVAAALHGWSLRQELAQRVSELAESRTRLVLAEEKVRRQMERDLHDGIQQQLVALLARIGLVRSLVGDGSPAVAQLEAARSLATDALSDLRHLVSGIHPALLSDRGLVAAVEARTTTLPLDVDVDADPRVVTTRFDPAVESSAYFLVCEALTNVIKHSGGTTARVVLAPLGAAGLRVAVVDEGYGTAALAEPRPSETGGVVGLTGMTGLTGLTGLRDRVEAVGGRFHVHAVPGVGTTVVAEFADSSETVWGEVSGVAHG